MFILAFHSVFTEVYGFRGDDHNQSPCSILAVRRRILTAPVRTRHFLSQR